MLESSEVHKALSEFGQNVVEQARTNFLDKNASGKGSQSLDFDVETFENSFGMNFSMEQYMEFQDKGVSGTKQKYDTPYSYTNKKPPASAFDKWGVRRGLAGRDEKGKFLTRKSLNFALATHVFKYGIKPSLFFTKAFEKEFENLPDNIGEAYALDVEKFMDSTLNNEKL